MRQIYGYFRDSSGYSCSEWQTRKNLMQPLLEKPPWLAVWDRLLRRLVRMTSRLGYFIPALSISSILFLRRDPRRIAFGRCLRQCAIR